MDHTKPHKALEAELHNNLHIAAQKHLEAEIALAMSPNYDTAAMVATTYQARAVAMNSLASYYRLNPARRPKL